MAMDNRKLFPHGDTCRHFESKAQQLLACGRHARPPSFGCTSASLTPGRQIRLPAGGGLLNRYRALKPYRGFESPSLRQIISLDMKRSSNVLAGPRAAWAVAFWFARADLKRYVRTKGTEMGFKAQTDSPGSIVNHK